MLDVRDRAKSRIECALNVGEPDEMSGSVILELLATDCDLSSAERYESGLRREC